MMRITMMRILMKIMQKENPRKENPRMENPRMKARLILTFKVKKQSHNLNDQKQRSPFFYQ